MTKFQTKVLKTVRDIRKGEVLTYKQVAERSGSPRAWRAVGRVMRENHDPLVPCHRVIKSNGEPGGYNGGEMEKELKLISEDAKFDKGKIIKYTCLRKFGG